MRHVRTLGPCLAALSAIAAIAATSASANPEWGQCFEKAGGKYTDSNCTKKASSKSPGNFEWRKATEVKNRNFTGEGGTGVLSSNFTICEPNPKKAPKCAEGETVEHLVATVECTKEANEGAAAPPNKVINVKVVFTGCLALGSFPCSNTATEGEIDVDSLKGSLGYINKAKKEVGVVLEPAVKHGAFAKFNCAGILTVTVGQGNAKEGAAYSPEITGGFDGIISPITPVNEMATAFTQVFSINEADENVPSHFEGKHIELLESWVQGNAGPEADSQWSKAGQTITNVNHPCVQLHALGHCLEEVFEPTEIKA